MSTFEVIRGVEGCCLALDDTRIAGPKPWGGGTVIHKWETTKEYTAVDTQSRWHELFGTPEKVADYFATQCMGGDAYTCEICPFADCDGRLHQAPHLTIRNELLEWLKGADE